MPSKYPQAFKDRAARMVLDRLEADEDGLTRYQVIKETAPKLNVSIEGLRRWVDQAEVDAGKRPGSVAPLRRQKVGSSPPADTGQRRPVPPATASSATRSCYP